MIETTFLRKLCRPVLASVLAFTVGGFVAVGCVDNSGNKTYPRGDAGADDGGDDVSVSDDAATGDDAPAADAPADAPASDTPASDGSAKDSSTLDASLPADAGGLDVRVDSGSGG